MFTGIIEEIGEVISLRKLTDGIYLTFASEKVFEDLKVDDSICIDGVCQTVVEIDDSNFSVEAVGETMLKTTLKNIQTGKPVNLERSLTLSSRLGGHLIQGHVNDTAKITQLFPRGNNFYLEIDIPSELQKYCVAEGSLAVDGISLTIAVLKENLIGFNIIPHTMKNTTLQYRKTDDRVNIEVDIIARYVENFIINSKSDNLSIEKLKNWGY